MWRRKTNIKGEKRRVEPNERIEEDWRREVADIRRMIIRGERKTIETTE